MLHTRQIGGMPVTPDFPVAGISDNDDQEWLHVEIKIPYLR